MFIHNRSSADQQSGVELFGPHEVTDEHVLLLPLLQDTLMCLEMGAVEVLIVWEALDCDRYELLNTGNGKTEVKHLTSEQAKNSDHFKDKETGEGAPIG